MSARLRILVFFLLALALASGADAPVSSAAPADPVVRARQAIAGRGPELGPDPDGLQTLTVRAGLGGQYVRFQETIGGVPVEGAQVVVALPDDPRRAPIVSGGRAPSVRAAGLRNVTAADALNLALDAARVGPRSLRGQPTVEEMYLSAGKEAILGWRITLPSLDPAGTWLVGVRADTGDILYVTDLRRFDSGRVFNPNPVKGSGGSIPPPFDCDSAASEALLSGQYETLALLGRTPAQGKLKGQYVDLTAPGIVGAYKPAGMANEASGDFIYGCDDDRFEEVMVYQHVDTTQRKIQSLGFSGEASIVGRPIPAHAHYFDDCNAFYDPADGGIHFGDADICSPTADAAEDADVIVHEYGHAIQDDQVPAWGFGSASAAEQAWAMGEGFSDFLTGAMFGDSCIGEWFSFGDACLRNISNTAHYPEDYDACRPAPPQPAEPHCAGLIWGGALWDLAQALGGDDRARDLALSLVLESQFLLDPLATFAEGAAAIRQADQLLFGGAHEATIDSVFAARGIGTLGGVADFPYAYLRIRHTFRGDLDVDLLVGSTSSPVCTMAIWNPTPSDGTDDLVGYVGLTAANCSSFLPPSVAQPWYLRVRDVFSQDVGTLEEFEVVLAGPQRCIATGLPITIPDADGFVFAQVDCSAAASATPSDDDGDGFDNPVEIYVGTDPSVPCGVAGWPADLEADSFMSDEDILDIADLTAFLAPIRRLDTSPGDADFDIRYDILPGTGIFTSFVNIADFTVLLTLTPPMFGGERALYHTCP
jgi:hypothetical protein